MMEQLAQTYFPKSQRAANAVYVGPRVSGSRWSGADAGAGPSSSGPSQPQGCERGPDGLRIPALISASQYSSHT
jgi:hypothetical protein